MKTAVAVQYIIPWNPVIQVFLIWTDASSRIKGVQAVFYISCVGDVQECRERRYTEQPKAQQLTDLMVWHNKSWTTTGSSSWACEPELRHEGALEPEELVNAFDTWGMEQGMEQEFLSCSELLGVHQSAIMLESEVNGVILPMYWCFSIISKKVWEEIFDKPRLMKSHLIHRYRSTLKFFRMSLGLFILCSFKWNWWYWNMHDVGTGIWRLSSTKLALFHMPKLKVEV